MVGIYESVSHPIRTAQGLGSAVMHPIDTGTAIKNDVVEKWNSGNEGKGEVFCEVVTSVLGVTKAGQAAKFSKLSKTVPDAAVAPRGGLGLADNALGQVDNVMLERLRLGAQIEVPAGTQAIRKTMSDLSVVSGNEVALIRMESGRRLIVMGGPNTIALPPRTARIIAHTHPQGSLQFSTPDIRALNARGQRSSVLISPREDFGIRLPVPPLGN